MSRLLGIGTDFGRLVCGLDSTKLLPPRLNYDETRAYADIQRAYLQKSDLIAPPSPLCN
jgi:hypothetical protein